MRQAIHVGLGLGLLTILLIAGCESRDDRLVKLATESAQRQAEQNRQMAQLQQEVASGSQRLIEAEAQSRQAFLHLQQDLHSQQADIGRQREELAADRRALAEQPQRDSVIAAALLQAAAILAALALLLCWQLLRAPAEISEATLSDLLIQELVSEQAWLLPGAARPALEHQTEASGERKPH